MNIQIDRSAESLYESHAAALGLPNSILFLSPAPQRGEYLLNEYVENISYQSGIVSQAVAQFEIRFGHPLFENSGKQWVSKISCPRFPLSIDFGNSAELLLKVSPIARAKCYEVQSAAIEAGNAPAPWQPAGLFTSSRITIADLVPGTSYLFQVRAIGATGYADWSNSVSRMCA